MNKNYYLRIYDGNQNFSFICDSISEEGDNIEEITASDILVTAADYDLYLQGVSSQKVFRLKTEIPAVGGLFDYIEEYTPDPPAPTETELLREQVQMLDGALNEVLFTILPEMQGGEI